MPQLKDNYNIFAGHDLQRTKTLADSTFSIAIQINYTLHLVLDIDLNKPIHIKNYVHQQAF